jgi:hypothetical protein
MTSDISISGIRLKKIDATTTNLTGNDGKTGKGRISSGHSAAHWGLKNLKKNLLFVIFPNIIF